MFFQKEHVYLEKKIQGEFDVTEKVKRKKHIPSRRCFLKDTLFEGESYRRIKTNVV